MRSTCTTATLLAAACTLALALSAPAGATVVEPRGTAFNAISSGAVAFHLGFTTVSCTGMTSNGVIPTGADNPNGTAHGSVTMRIAAPAFTGCTSELVGRVTVTTNATNGEWTLTFMTLGLGVSDGAITIPPSGIVITGGGEGIECSYTGSWSVSTPMTGTWASASHALMLSNQQTADSVVGTLCPSEFKVLTFTGTLALTTALGGVTVG
jgi:hypothetical protein